MRAMILECAGEPLALREIPAPKPGPGELLLRVEACGVCRTDLHLVDGDVPVGRLPRILGHQIVGTVEGTGERVGVPWLGWTCGDCEHCRGGRENLCPDARFTGRDIDGGFAEFAVADARYCFPIPKGFEALQAAPLLCAGLIGHRALSFCGDARRLGLYGFGSAAHIVTQIARARGCRVYAFTRPGDQAAQDFARRLGCVWAGGSDQRPRESLDGAIIFAPAGELVLTALRAVAPGGAVVCAGIHMTDIPSFRYSDLWMERSIRSVANLTRADGESLLRAAAAIPVRTEVTSYPLEAANEALTDLRAGRFVGSAAVVP